MSGTRWRRVRRIWTTPRTYWRLLLVLVTLAAAGATAGSTAPAHAAGMSPEVICRVSPSNASCNGVPLADVGDGVCWTSDSYSVNDRYGNTLYWAFPNPFSDWTAETQLWYSPECKTNWAVTFLYYENCSEKPTWSTKVRRNSGPDGGYLMFHGQWVIGCYPNATFPEDGVAVSPMVYSPDNTAQACASFPSNDQYVCTKSF